MINKLVFKKGAASAVLSILLAVCYCTAQAQSADSLDIKIGQMLLIGLPTSKVDDKVLEEVQQGKVGSIILFEKNIPRDNSFIALKKITWTYQQAAPVPLFIAIDQEGGRVNRLKDKYGFPKSITAEAMGRAPTPDSVRFYGEATAATLKGLGINVNFAPVVDLASNPHNPIIAKHGRAFSADEDKVALLAKAWIAAHREVGVVTVLKHFPGHGSSRHDTHLGIADVTDTWEERELVPYKKLIQAGKVDAIMSAHIVNKKLDPAGHPGTLSAPILDGILRKRLQYDGVIFSDDMQMHAITKHYGLEEAVRRAINAGIDIMTFSNNIEASEERTVDRVHTLIKRMVASGAIPAERIDQSYRRIMKLKEKLVFSPEASRTIAIMECRLEVLKKENELKAATLELKRVQDENVLLKNELAEQAGGRKKKKKK